MRYGGLILACVWDLFAAPAVCIYQKRRKRHLFGPTWFSLVTAAACWTVSGVLPRRGSPGWGVTPRCAPNHGRCLSAAATQAAPPAVARDASVVAAVLCPAAARGRRRAVASGSVFLAQAASKAPSPHGQRDLPQQRAPAARRVAAAVRAALSSAAATPPTPSRPAV